MKANKDTEEVFCRLECMHSLLILGGDVSLRTSVTSPVSPETKAPNFAFTMFGIATAWRSMCPPIITKLLQRLVQR